MGDRCAFRINVSPQPSRVLLTRQSLHRHIAKIRIGKKLSTIPIGPAHSFREMVDILRTIVTHARKIIRFQNVEHGHDGNST